MLLDRQLGLSDPDDQVIPGVKAPSYDEDVSMCDYERLQHFLFVF